jgi:uncharacterized integral membrane protein (TIGR00698 family)
MNRASLARLLSGLGAAVGVAVVARGAGHFLPAAVSEVALAVFLGLLVRNLVRMPTGLEPGLRFAVRWVLRAGIILLGARLSIDQIVRVGGSAVALIIVCLLATLALGILLARRLRIGRLGLLIAVGTAICGNSAIVATAPVIEADEREVAFAVTTITVFGVLAVLLYPFIGHALALTAPRFGLWAGTAVNDTSQVVATAYSYSPVAGDVATVVKLTRNLFMAPVIVGIGLVAASARRLPPLQAARAALPLFVLGFLAVAVARSIGWLDVYAGPLSLATLASDLAQVCILVALAGVGLQTDLAVMRRIGMRPLYAGLGLATMLAGLSLGLIQALSLGK